MKPNLLFFSALICLLAACSSSDGSSLSNAVSVEKIKEKAGEHLPSILNRHAQFINPKGNTLATRIEVPEGFKRVKVETNSFEEYLRYLPVKPDGSPVMHYDGSQKMRDVHVAIVDIDVGKQDLQQCADAVMRMRSEYLYKEKKYDQIHFNFTNGFRVDYDKWRQGYRTVVKGNKSWWEKKAEPDNGYKSFRKYLNEVFMYAGSLSLSKEMVQVKDTHSLKAGDVFILGGTPGHAVTVMDVAVNSDTGETIFLVSQSFMPAQDIHILRNDREPKTSPWFSLDFGEDLHTPEFIFHKSHLMRF